MANRPLTARSLGSRMGRKDPASVLGQVSPTFISHTQAVTLPRHLVSLSSSVLCLRPQGGLQTPQHGPQTLARWGHAEAAPLSLGSMQTPRRGSFHSLLVVTQHDFSWNHVHGPVPRFAGHTKVMYHCTNVSSYDSGCWLGGLPSPLTNPHSGLDARLGFSMWTSQGCCSLSLLAIPARFTAVTRVLLAPLEAPLTKPQGLTPRLCPSGGEAGREVAKHVWGHLHRECQAGDGVVRKAGP